MVQKIQQFFRPENHCHQRPYVDTVPPLFHTPALLIFLHHSMVTSTDFVFPLSAGFPKDFVFFLFWIFLVHTGRMLHDFPQDTQKSFFQLYLCQRKIVTAHPLFMGILFAFPPFFLLFIHTLPIHTAALSTNQEFIPQSSFVMPV